jgi:hypothetical protein
MATASRPDPARPSRSDQAPQAAGVLNADHVVVVHTDWWARFSRGSDTVAAAFPGADESARLLDARPGVPVTMPDAAIPAPA